MFEFGLLPLIESSPAYSYPLSECDTKMVRDGTRTLDNSEKRTPIYKCMECAGNSNQSGTYKTYPNSLEIYKIKLFDEILDNFEKYHAM